MTAADTHGDALVTQERQSRNPGRSARRFRIAQVRSTAKTFVLLDRVRLGRVTAGQVVRAVAPAAILRGALGYRRVFGSLAEAQSVAKRFIGESHDHPDNARMHLALASRPRPSDYPVLFHLAGIIGDCRSVLDLGGNVGNLFYCYSQHLSFAPDLRWTVCDVPEMCTLGAAIAAQRGETRLHFDGNADSFGGADLLLASGCIHYFEKPLAGMIASARVKPTHVIVNRTPLTDGETTVTVQDAGKFLAACKLYRKHDLIASMTQLGYELVDMWEVPELSVHIPCHPELSVPAYSGCYFRLK